MKKEVMFAALVALLAMTTVAQDIRMPPSIIKGPPRLVRFSAGQEITLPCIATGVPEPDFYWELNGVVQEKNTAGVVWNKGSITIISTTANYEGDWQCFAKNQYGKSMSTYAKLVMTTMGAYPPGQTARKYTANQGEKLKLTCDGLKSVPTPSYTWSYIDNPNDIHQGTPVQITDRIQIDDTGNLYFANVVATDHLNGQIYKCNIYNPGSLTTVGGSLSTIEVQPGSPASRLPTIEYRTPSPSYGLRTRTITFKCLFAGNPTPRVTWSKVGGSLPFARYKLSNADTTLTLEGLQDSDEGEYECNGINSGGENKHRIQLVIHSEPVFVKDIDRPMNDNYTEGEEAVFRCHADALPAADVQWYINGDEINVGTEGPRQTISEGGLKLTIEQLCKDCSGEGSHQTDLMNVQCMATNEYNYTFADAYLNVLRRTVLTVDPEDHELEYGEEVIFKCAAETDDSTSVTIQWEKNGEPIFAEEGKIEIDEENSLHLFTREMDDEGASMEGKYTCIATNGYSTDTDEAQLTLPAGAVPVKGAGVGDFWWIFVIVAIILLLLILIFCCCLCCQRNRGDSYPVDEKERAQGNDPEKELENDGYHDYQRPEDAPIKGSRASLTSTIKLDSDDEGSLNEYGGDLDTGKFNEDGSFIGQYIEKDKKRPKDSQV